MPSVEKLKFDRMISAGVLLLIGYSKFYEGGWV